MSRYRMEGVDLGRLKIAHQILSQVVDRLVELEDLEPELEWEPTPDRVEVDRLTPHSQYDCYDGFYPGMLW
jgi:hypothetical protein